MKDKVDKKEKILDPCAGMGPWKEAGYETIEKNSIAGLKEIEFLKIKKSFLPKNIFEEVKFHPEILIFN